MEIGFEFYRPLSHASAAAVLSMQPQFTFDLEQVRRDLGIPVCQPRQTADATAWTKCERISPENKEEGLPILGY